MSLLFGLEPSLFIKRIKSSLFFSEICLYVCVCVHLESPFVLLSEIFLCRPYPSLKNFPLSSFIRRVSSWRSLSFPTKNDRSLPARRVVVCVITIKMFTTVWLFFVVVKPMPKCYLICLPIHLRFHILPTISGVGGVVETDLPPGCIHLEIFLCRIFGI